MSRVNCRCNECNALLVVVSSGGVCPNGHGRIVPGVTRRDIARVRRQITRDERDTSRDAAIAATLAAVAQLPLCHYCPTRSAWTIDGHAALYRRVAGPYAPANLDAMGESHRAAGRTLARTADGRWCVLRELPTKQNAGE